CKSNETCGNGVLDNKFSDPSKNEICDDGNNLNDDGCSSDCHSNGTCGNAVRDQGEECDDGAASGNEDDCVIIVDANNNKLCKLNVCGDGFVDRQPPRTEQCDDKGESAGCNLDCTLAMCGDRKINRTAGEQCDDGAVDTATCNKDCTAAIC